METGFSKVYPLNEKYVKKVVKRSPNYRLYGYAPSIIELEILHQIKSPYLLSGNGCKVLHERGEVEIYLPRAEHDLTVVEKFTEEEHILFMYQVAHGLYTLHQNNILHLDIKPDNILVKDGKALLCDYNCSKVMHPRNEKISGTAMYFPPEALLELLIGKKILYEKSFDIWSLAMTFFLLISRKYSFDLKNGISLGITGYYGKIRGKFKDKSNPKEYIRKNIKSNKLVSLLKCMLNYDPKKRPDIKWVISCLEKMIPEDKRITLPTIVPITIPTIVPTEIDLYTTQLGVETDNRIRSVATSLYERVGNALSPSRRALVCLFLTLWIFSWKMSIIEYLTKVSSSINRSIFIRDQGIILEVLYTRESQEEVKDTKIQKDSL